MPLATRIIPILLKRGDALVKGTHFNSSRIVGHALQAAKIHQARGVDELVIIDVGATLDGRGPDCKAVEKLTKDCFVPLTIGGGVRSVQDVRDLMNAGADKILLETAWMMNPDLLWELSGKFGSQAIVVSLSVKQWLTTSHCGTVPHTRHVLDVAHDAVMAGAGELLLQDIERDGLLRGYNTELIDVVSRSVSVPVIASCGCGSYQDMRDAISAGASAVAAGSMFLFNDLTPLGAAQYLSGQGVEVRIPA